jgi:4-amino-4-deoxy-L-arabinose transferase-like glycosyltransferase
MKFLILKHGKQRWFKYLFHILLFVVLYSVFVTPADFTDDAFFGGDTWEYQSMAVNFAKGHGINKFGGIENFDTYKFAKPEHLPEYYTSFVQRAGMDNFFRPPAYSLFLGLIYKLFGISPRIAKLIQLALLTIVAVCLPWIGFHYWKLEGLISGFIAAPIYLVTNHKLAEVILTEALTAFSLFLIVAGYIFFEKRNSTVSAVLLGIALGFAVLVKAILIFIPLLAGIWLLYTFFRRREKRILKNMLVIIISALFTISPWSLYASMKSNSFILLSTQGGGSLLDGNNEFNSDGGWHPEWRNRKDSFYNNGALAQASTIEKIARFYTQHPSLLPRLIVKKLVKGFVPMMFLLLIIAIFIIERYVVCIEMYVKNTFRAFVYYTFALFMLTLSTFGVYFLSEKPSSLYAVFRGNLLISILLLIAVSLPLLLVRLKNVGLRIPSVFVMIFLNFVILIALFFADSGVYKSRFVQVMDFIFILVALQYLLMLMKRITSNLFLLTND